MKKENKMPTSVDFSGGERGKFLGKFKNKCPFCAGAAKQTTKDLQLARDGQIYKFEDVPTITCDECGEQFISGKTFSTLSRTTK